MTTEKPKANVPAHTCRAGALRLTIWRNVTEKGIAWYSVSPTRSYKQDDGTWHETPTLGADDLLPMAELHREAWAWIARQMQADARARKETEAVAA
jgi:hypothetical protein